MMKKTNTPIRLWDYVFQYTSNLITLKAADIFSLQDITLFEIVHHYTLDILEYLFFSWYSWIRFHDPVAEDYQALWCFLRSSSWHGSRSLANHILNNNEIMVIRSTIKPLSQDNQKYPVVITRMKVNSTKVNSAIRNWRNFVMKGVEYNEGDPYQDLFQGVN